MVQRQLSRYRQTHSSLSRTLLRFRNRLRDDREEILRRESILSQLLQERIDLLREELGTARSKLDRAHPGRRLDAARTAHRTIHRRLLDSMQAHLLERRTSMKLAMGRLHALSPLSVLDRGFSVVTTSSGLISSAKMLRAGDDVQIRFSDGKVRAKVNELFELDDSERINDE